MLNVAICDDEIWTCSEIEEMIHDYEKYSFIKIQTKVFYSGESLMKVLEDTHNYDILFLDIELIRLNGVEVGKIIREQIKDEIIKIVYISSKKHYAMELFQVRPFDFLVKPIEKKQLFQLLDKVKAIEETEKKFFEYQIGRNYARIHIDKILYFKCEVKKIKIILEKQEKEFYGRMKDTQEKLSAEIFWVIHKSYIVNINYVQEFRYTEVVLTNGEVLPISQKYRGGIKDKLLARQLEVNRYDL